MQPSLLETLFTADAVSIVFQPIFRVRQGTATAVAVEALARGPRNTPFESPLVLFEYVRRKRAEVAVDRECVRLSIASYAALTTSLRLSVNVHASTLGRDEDFADFLIRQCEMQRLPASRVAIEIVEHSPAWNEGRFHSSLFRLREAGIMVALDDVGLGNSNYRMVLDCRPNYLKLDSYIVHGCHNDAGRKAILSSVAKLAQDLGAEVVAEGVETAEELNTVVDRGIELVQGYIFCRPLVPEVFARTLGSTGQPISAVQAVPVNSLILQEAI
jgi:EAL domain-containing protein (putative c-di-GMP-specific phosphodiesterase class I)